MARKMIGMRVAREILAYLLERNMSQRAAAQIVAVDRTVVAKVFNRYRASGLPWPIPNAVSDTALRQVIYPRIGAQAEQHHIDFDTVHLALQLKGATLAILHQEWADEDPARNDLGYQQFCRRYKNYRRQLQISMRRTDQFGEVAYVDYSGMTAKYFDRHSMQDVECQVFIGVLGGSQYTYCEATHSQRLRDWLGSHVRMFAFFGGVPRAIVPDNLKSAVTKADRFFPTINESYQALCQHYGTLAFPARAGRPKDKPKAEAGVLLAQRWILFVLRKRRFFSLDELNREIAVLLTKLNEKKFQKKAGSRLLKWIEHERPALLPLPAEPYVLAEWGKVRAGQDYHVEIEHSFYSVPHRFRNTEIDFRLSDQSVELLHDGEAIACHRRSNVEGSLNTRPEHQPPNHKAVAAWSAEEALSWARGIGEQTTRMLELQLDRSRNFLSGYRTTEGMRSLCKKYGSQRVEEVCAYALENNVTSMQAIRTILSKSLDSLLPQGIQDSSVSKIVHENIRGAGYYARILSESKEQSNDE